MKKSNSINQTAMSNKPNPQADIKNPNKGTKGTVNSGFCDNPPLKAGVMEPLTDSGL